MKDFLFFKPDPLGSYDSSLKEARGKAIEQESHFFQGIRETIKSGIGLSRFLQHRNEADLVFITVFHSDSYHKRRLDYIDDVNKHGTPRSKKNSTRQNKLLAQDIEGLGFGFIKVEGYFWGIVEESYCVINYAEDTSFFVKCLSELVKKYDQEYIFVVPKGEDAYFYNYNGATQKLGTGLHIIGDSIKNYTTFKGHNFAFSVVKDLFCRDSLSPIRSGKITMIPISQRHKLLHDSYTNFLIKLIRG